MAVTRPRISFGVMSWIAAFCGTDEASAHTPPAPMHSSASSPEGISGAAISNGAARAKRIVAARTCASL